MHAGKVVLLLCCWCLCNMLGMQPTQHLMLLPKTRGPQSNTCLAAVHRGLQQELNCSSCGRTLHCCWACAACMLVVCPPYSSCFFVHHAGGQGGGGKGCGSAGWLYRLTALAPVTTDLLGALLLYLPQLATALTPPPPALPMSHLDTHRWQHPSHSGPAAQPAAPGPVVCRADRGPGGVCCCPGQQRRQEAAGAVQC